MDDLWNHESSAREHIDVPAWIDQDINGSTLEAINQGGCASGAYMPAVTYYDAGQTMAKHGDEVLQYIEDRMGELPSVADQSWAQMACTYLSTAVELWATGAAEELLEALETI